MGFPFWTLKRLNAQNLWVPTSVVQAVVISVSLRTFYLSTFSKGFANIEMGEKHGGSYLSNFVEVH